MRPLIRLILMFLFSSATDFSVAQSIGELESQFQNTCSSGQIAALPDLKPQCDLIRTTLDKMRILQAPRRSTSSSRPDVDNSTQCACTRKLGSCSASARVTSQEITRVPAGLSSRVSVRTEPPPGQCVEVTVFLQETAQLATGVNRRGHPLYQVIKGPNDVEWRNVGTPASKLEYSILSNDTECHVCDAGKGGTAANSDVANKAEVDKKARSETRESYRVQYRDCVAGRGELVAQLSASMRSQICAKLKEEMDKVPE